MHVFTTACVQWNESGLRKGNITHGLGQGVQLQLTDVGTGSL